VRWEVARRPEQLRWPEQAAGQSAKLVEAFDFVEREVDLGGDVEADLGGDSGGEVGGDVGVNLGGDRGVDLEAPVHIGHVALATTLAWIEFREVADFRTGRPRLSRWFDAFMQRPSMRATDYSGDTHD
jgi:hypothetical protein